MANADTTSELHKSVLRKCGEKDDGSSEFHATALDYINRVYQKIISGSAEFEVDLGDVWPWAKSANVGILTLQPWFGSQNPGQGNVTLTFGSVNGTFSLIPQQNAMNISLAGYYIQPTNGNFEWYKIATHVSGSTAFTLDGPFNSQLPAGDYVNGPFTACLLDYTLTVPEVGGIQRLASPFEIYRTQTFDNDQEAKIYGIDIREMRRLYPLNLITVGMATRFAVTYQQDGVIKVRFNKYPDVQTRAEYEYIPVPTDLTSNPDTTPIIPREFRDALVYGAAYYLCTDKNDDRAQTYLALTQAILKALIEDIRKNKDHTQKTKATLVPRLDLVNQKKKILNL